MENQTDQREKILTAKLARPTVSQTEAAVALNLSQGRISSIIKEGKIEADEKNRPYIDSILKYKTHPKMKRTRQTEK